MIHNTLPTCDRIFKLVEAEKNKPQQDDFFQNKYGKVTNGGMRPCCNLEKETVEHLFSHCTNKEISYQRDSIYNRIRKTLKNKAGITSRPTPFFHNSHNQSVEPSTKWDLQLGNLGLLPHDFVKWVKSEMDPENPVSLKYVIPDITKAIMKSNLKIWKHRCKILYGNANNSSP